MLTLLLLPLTGVAARADVPGPSVQLTDDFSSESSSARETSIGDVVADAIRHAGDAQVALVDAESLQPLHLPKGPVRVKRFRDALSYAADPIDVLTIKGDVLVTALERGVSNLPQAGPGFLQVSGLAYTLDERAKAGSRTGRIFLLNQKPLDRNAVYTVAMPESLAQGANGYFLVWPAGAPTRRVAQTLGDAVTAFVGAHDTLTPSLNRIVS